MRLFFSADVHGEWVRLYSNLSDDAVLFICGDAEPLRNEADLELVPAPKKHLKLGDFQLFWERKRMPVPTYVLLGNHEPFAWLQEYEERGPCELMENFWILRRAGVVELCGCRIAYLSRIFSPTAYRRKPWKPTPDCKKSKLAGRFTERDVEALLDAVAEAGGADVLAMHDNPMFCEDPTGQEVFGMLVDLIRPELIVCGHMHRHTEGTFRGVPVVGLGKGEVWKAAMLL